MGARLKYYERAISGIEGCSTCTGYMRCGKWDCRDGAMQDFKDLLKKYPAYRRTEVGAIQHPFLTLDDEFVNKLGVRV